MIAAHANTPIREFITKCKQATVRTVQLAACPMLELVRLHLVRLWLGFHLHSSILHSSQMAANMLITGTIPTIITIE